MAESMDSTKNPGSNLPFPLSNLLTNFSSMTHYDSTAILASLDNNSVTSLSNSFYTDSSRTLSSSDHYDLRTFGNALMSDKDLDELRVMAKARGGGGSRPAPRPSRPSPPRHVPSHRPTPRPSRPSPPRHVPRHTPAPRPSSLPRPVPHHPSTSTKPHVPSSGDPKSDSTPSQRNGHAATSRINKLGLLLVLTSAVLIMQ